MSFTRGGMCLIALIAFLLLVAPPGSATNFIVVSLFSSLVLLNMPLALLAVRRVSIRREHPTHVKEGSTMRTRLVVENLSRSARILLNFRDELAEHHWSEPVVLPVLPGRGTENVSYEARAPKRGVYGLSAVRIESCAPFGLVKARRFLDAISRLVVYPLYYELAGADFPFSRSYSGLTAAPASRPGEGLSFFGLREYRDGDPIRKIHWPSTLRARTLMVKEFEEDLHSSIAILLDTCRASIRTAGNIDSLEAAIRVAATLANYMLTNGHPTALLHRDGKTGELHHEKAMGELTPILDSLARLTPFNAPPADLIVSASAGAARYANWVVIMLSPDQAALEQLLRERARGLEIFLIVVDQTGPDPRPAEDSWFPSMMGLLEGAGVPALFMKPGDDIQAVLSRGLRRPRRVWR